MAAKRTNFPDNQSGLKALAEMQLLSSIISSRASLAGNLGKSFGGKRDIYEALGYPRNLTYDDYFNMYKRGVVACRIIEAPVDGVWEQKPEIVEDIEAETQFEKGIQDIIKKKRLFHYLRRVDLLSCIGEYAVLLLGVDDGLELNEPMTAAKELLYIQPYSENSAEIVAWDKDQQSPRYGLPESYRLKIAEPGKVDTYKTQDVHHSRVVHVAQGLLESNVYGTPRLERIFNRLLNLELIVGGSAEMFWQGAFPGLQFNAQPEMNMSQTAADMKEKIDEYVHGLKRYLTTQGLDVNKLSADIANPQDHVAVQLSMISIASGIPKRILEGSERGELASSQDGENWNDRLDSRRRDETEPSILRPFIDRLISVGVVAPPAGGEYTVSWPDLNDTSPKEKADVGKIRTEATAKYIESGMDILIPPKQYFEEMLDMPVDQVDRLLAGAENALEDMREEERQAAEDAKENQFETNANTCHNPAGSPNGGQFCSPGGPAASGSMVSSATILSNGTEGGRYAAAANKIENEGNPGVIIRDNQGSPVAAASFTTISDSVQIDVIGSIKPGGGSAAIYESIKYSESQGKNGALTVASIGNPTTIGFYANIGFDIKPGTTGRTFFLKDGDAQMFKQAYEQKTGGLTPKVHSKKPDEQSKMDKMLQAIQDDLDGKVLVIGGDGTI